jgi:ABC-2 type transport system permease protein
MHNLGNVIRFEVVRVMKKPTFWISTLAFPILIAVIWLLVFISNKSGQDQLSDLSNAELSNIAVIDNSGYVTENYANNLDISLVNDQHAALERVKSGDSDLLVVYPSNPESEKTLVFGKDSGLFSNSKYDSAAQGILMGAVASSVGSEQTVTLLQSRSLDMESTFYNEGEVAPGFERVVAPMFFLVIFYLVVLLLSNQMLTSTTEEKENRVTEIILTTVKSGTLIFGKIVALFALGVIQILTLLIPAVIAFLFMQQDFSAMTEAMGIDIAAIFAVDFWQMLIASLLLVGGLLLYTGLLVAIGAAVPTAKEANGFFGAAIAMMFAPLWILMLIITSPSLFIVQVFSFFPLSAPVALLLRNAFGGLDTATAITGIVVVWSVAILLLYIAARIFKYGTLEYSRRLSIKEIVSKKSRA